jgi:hypothetical protein
MHIAYSTLGLKEARAVPTLEARRGRGKPFAESYVENRRATALQGRLASLVSGE